MTYRPRTTPTSTSRRSPVWRRLASLLAASLLFVGCGTDDGPAPLVEREEPLVVTALASTDWLARSIVGDLVPVRCVLPDGQDPMLWTPNRDTVSVIQSASLIVLNGAEAEPWVPRVSLPGSRVVQLSRPLEAELITRQQVTHSHGSGPSHTHAAIDGTTWMDPQQLIQQAEHLTASLVRRFPDHETALLKGRESVRETLLALDTELASRFQALPEVTLIASHPSYAYLARRYDLTVQDVEVLPDVVPDDAVLASLEDAQDGATRAVLLWPTRTNDLATEAIERATGIRSVWFDDLVDPSLGQDVPERLRDSVSRLEQALQ